MPTRPLSSPLFRKAICRSVIILFLLTLTSSYASLSGQRINYCEQASAIVKSANKYHYAPRTVDDQFAELLFPQFMELLDPTADYFIADDIAQLEAFKYNIDNDIQLQSCTFLEMATALYNKRLLFVDSLLTTFQAKKIIFTQPDTISLKLWPDYLTQKQLIGKWEKLIKLRILSSYYSNLDTLQKNRKPLPEELADLQKKIIASQHCRIKSRLSYQNGLSEFVGTHFLRTVATTFDPHTNYLSVSEEQEFEGMLSKEINSFGLSVQRNDMGEIEIADLVPGSSAWSSNNINAGDVILKIKADNIEKEFGCIALDEVESFFNSNQINEAEFTIRKKNGQELVVTLNKTKVDVQENIIRSYVLEGQTKIGYIYLPSFYSQFDNGTYTFNGCASDVSKELVKLKNENINGLILDLRNNGGGSMMEAIQLSGIFIDYGAICISESRNEVAETLKDFHKGTIYDAPLLVLINQFSASASELFAAAMQDQNRAVIVGTQSYGKATMQRVMPVDAYKYEAAEKYEGTPTGYVKLTTGAFYRVNGTSHQKTGVVPDVKLPTIYCDIDLSERAEKTALDTKTIDKKSYYYPRPALPLQKLNERSNTRLMQNNAFIDVQAQGKKVVSDYYNLTVPLTIEGFSKLYYEKNDDEEPKANNSFAVAKPSYFSNTGLLNDTAEIETTTKNIKNDIYIGEAYHIINDLINLIEPSR